MNFNLINSDPGFISSHLLNDYSPGENKFTTGDDFQTFKESLKNSPKDWYYRNHEVKYVLNSNRFRTKEFKDIDWKNSIVLIGCSCTFGVGVTEEDTIAANLQEITGKYVVNLGQPGASNSAIAYNSYYLKENYPEPLAVVNLWTGITRYFVLDERFEVEFCIPGVTINNIQKTNNMLTPTIHNIMFMRMVNYIWKDHPNYIQTCCNDIHGESTGGSTLEYSIARKLFPEALYVEKYFWGDPTARDCKHPGRRATKGLAKLIASNLKL